MAEVKLSMEEYHNNICHVIINFKERGSDELS